MVTLPLEHMISLCTPLECLICKLEGNMLCSECAEKTFEQHISRCYLCNKLTESSRVCRSCRNKSALRRVWWMASYEGVTKDIIHSIKYGRRRAYARECGAYLASALPFLQESVIVVPVPTASSRIRQRSFDQAVLMAQTLAGQRELQFKQPLVRMSQVDQVGKRRSERFEQIKNSMAVKDGLNLKGAEILLVDDVLTTGATLETAARLLRAAGAKHVDAAVIARHLIK